MAKENKMFKAFPITSVCRGDLVDAGFTEKQAARVTDAQMERIASKLADDYCEQLFWSSLEIIADYVVKSK